MQQSIDIREITETIADITEDYFLVCDNNAQIVFCNKAMKRYLGYEEITLVHMSFFDIISNTKGNDAQLFFEDISCKVLESGNFPISRKSGIGKLDLKFIRKNNLVYIHANEKYEDYEKLKRKLKTEITNAIKIHRTSLPKDLPLTDNISFSALYLPAEELGGDLYDVFRVDNGLLNDYFEQYICFIADVSGHGLDSAMLAMFVKDTIRSFFSLRHIPGQVLSSKEIMDFFVDHYLKEGYPDEYLVCLSIVAIDLNAKELIYCNAGIHECPLLIREAETIIELKNGGLPVSSAIDRAWLTYEEHSITLTDQMTLFLMSDGLPEQKSAGEVYESRIKSLFSKIYSMSAEEIVGEIHCDFMGFIGDEKISDDITLIVARLENN